MLLQIIIGAIRQPPQFLKTKGKFVFEIFGALAVKAALFVAVFAPAQTFWPHAEIVRDKTQNVLFPIFKQRFPIGGFRIKEIFYFALLEFQGPEDKVALGNFIPEALPELADTERQRDAG